MYRSVKSKYCHVNLAKVALIKPINSTYLHFVKSVRIFPHWHWIRTRVPPNTNSFYGVLQKYGGFILSAYHTFFSFVEYCHVWFLLNSLKSTDFYKAYGFNISIGLHKYVKMLHVLLLLFSSFFKKRCS